MKVLKIILLDIVKFIGIILLTLALTLIVLWIEENITLDDIAVFFKWMLLATLVIGFSTIWIIKIKERLKQ